ncbi:DUF4132 domain-containing protein [Actinomadura physcomitrii]|uniref:DUF4132 domain-containing protein n=1 Tax=Actinomadura physcomitrii TaxID=2650748 RepID=UPI0019235EB8|nr:DUF4132 domain-containing protein [Actinomadura physcomitrii]
MDDLPPLPDEDALTLPAAWRRRLHPRRGGLPGPAFPVDGAAPARARALVEKPGGPVAAIAPDESGAPDLAEAALRHLAGEPGPAGAAAAAAVAVLDFTLRRADAPYETFIDSWVRLGLSTDQLADRIVPAFGLDCDGTMTLDYGPRRFTVGFDEALRPVVADEAGKARKSLPKPGAKDDPALAPAAYRTFADLKKDVRAVAADLLRRLEDAMVAQRRWTPAEFGEHIVGHPLVRHVARRLVWFAQDGDAATPFRIAEDRTYADVGDDLVDVPEHAAIGLAHPVRLGDALGAWSEVFADYEILQPFPQLGRAVHALADAERDGDRLERFEHLKVPLGTVLGLTGRGWEIGAPQDGGVQRWISRRAPRGPVRRHRPGPRPVRRRARRVRRCPDPRVRLARRGGHRPPVPLLRGRPAALRRPRRRHRVRDPRRPRPPHRSRRLTPERTPCPTRPQTTRDRPPRCDSPTSWNGSASTTTGRARPAGR